MHKQIHSTWIVMVGSLIVLALTGCSSAEQIGASVFATTTLPRVVPITGVEEVPTIPPTQTIVPPVAPTSTPLALPTATHTAAPVRPTTATPTRRQVSAPSPTATPVYPPGVYVTAIKVDPSTLHSNQAPQFTVTFLNTAVQTQDLTWYVKIFSPDQANSFGETEKIPNNIPPGVSRLSAVANWQTQTYSACSFFFARSFWVDPNGQINEFLTPTGTSLGVSLSVCP
jgi:hypothetical protein